MASVHNASIEFDTLDGALRSGDENTIIQELRRAKTQKSSELVAKVAQILTETDSARIRNAAAVALADMNAREKADVILQLLMERKTQSSRGTLLFALEQMGAKIPLKILAEIILTDSYEARQEALGLIKAQQTTFTQAELRGGEKVIRESLSSLTSERFDTAQAALKILSGAGDLNARKGARKNKTF